MSQKLKHRRSKFGFGITSKFLNLPFVLLIFTFLIFANYLILPGSIWIYNIMLTLFIFPINFYLGYYTIRALLLKGRHRSYVFQVFFLLLLSYLVVPVIATYLSTVIGGWGWFFMPPRNFFELIIIVFGINLLVNTFLLIIYYTNSSIVVFGEGENTELPVDSPDNSTEKMFAQGEITSRTGNFSQIGNNNSKSKVSNKEYFLLKSNRVLTRIHFNEIVYLEVNLNNVLIQTVKRFYETRSTLGEIVKNLPDNFVQISKSIVINLDFFDQLVFDSETKRNKVKISYPGDGEDEEESFYVGRKFLASFKEKLSK